MFPKRCKFKSRRLLLKIVWDTQFHYFMLGYFALKVQILHQFGDTKKNILFTKDSSSTTAWNIT